MAAKCAARTGLGTICAEERLPACHSALSAWRVDFLFSVLFFFSFFQVRASLCDLPWLSWSEGLFLVLISKHYPKLGRLTIF